ncbi:MAG: hypothetical protein AAB426_05350 [Myxococcota bacterium]
MLLPLVLVLLGAASPTTPDVDREPVTAPGAVARPVTKIRQGSVLHREQTEAPAPDLRTPWERGRDALVALHLARVAQLDVIAEAARTMQDVALQERVDDVRRKELQGFYEQMRAWHGRIALPASDPGSVAPPVEALPSGRPSYKEALERARATIRAEDAADRLAEIIHDVERERAHAP